MHTPDGRRSSPRPSTPCPPGPGDTSRLQPHGPARCRTRRRSAPWPTRLDHHPVLEELPDGRTRLVAVDARAGRRHRAGRTAGGGPRRAARLSGRPGRRAAAGPAALRRRPPAGARRRRPAAAPPGPLRPRRHRALHRARRPAARAYDGARLARVLPGGVVRVDGDLGVTVEGEVADPGGVVRRVLGLDDDLTELHEACRQVPSLALGARRGRRAGAARADRVGGPGRPAAVAPGRRSAGPAPPSPRSSASGPFPTPDAVARRPDLPGGYRAPWLRALARAVADGDVDPEAWRALDDDEVQARVRAPARARAVQRRVAAAAAGPAASARCSTPGWPRRSARDAAAAVTPPWAAGPARAVARGQRVLAAPPAPGCGAGSVSALHAVVGDGSPASASPPALVAGGGHRGAPGGGRRPAAGLLGPRRRGPRALPAAAATTPPRSGPRRTAVPPPRRPTPVAGTLLDPEPSAEPVVDGALVWAERRSGPRGVRRPAPAGAAATGSGPRRPARPARPAPRPAAAAADRLRRVGGRAARRRARGRRAAGRPRGGAGVGRRRSPGPRPLDDGARAASRAAAATAWCSDAFGAEVDLRSNEAVLALLQARGFDVADTRSWRLEPHRATSPAVAALLDWRRAERVATTYGYRWLDEHLGADGRLRGTLDRGRGRRPDDGGRRAAQPAGVVPARRSPPSRGTSSSGPTSGRSSRGCSPSCPATRRWPRPPRERDMYTPGGRAPSASTGRPRRSPCWPRCTGRPAARPAGRSSG